ncbi:MAG: ATP-dependent DNA ligase [Candidatus Bathyarchaeia archaeon]
MGEGMKRAGGTPFSELASLCSRLEGTGGRREKVKHLGAFLRGLGEEEAIPAVSLLTDRALRGSALKALGVSFSTIQGALEGVRGEQASLLGAPPTISEVFEALRGMAAASGEGSRGRRERLLIGLLGRMGQMEREYFVRMLLGEVRIGVVEGMMLEAIASAAGVDIRAVKRAYALLGDLGEVAKRALSAGTGGLEGIGITLFQPLRPMLADTAADPESALAEHGGRSALEFKLDGARVQIHKRGDRIRIYSRRLADVTDSLPDIVDLASGGIYSGEALLDGEVVAVGDGGRPLPFQTLMERFKRIHDVGRMVEQIPLRLFLFDAILNEGETLIDRPYEERRAILEEACSRDLIVGRVTARGAVEAERYLEEALGKGHEGILAKSLDGPYSPGARSRDWLKIKPSQSLDLVIVAAEWGHGRRSGWLSNYHLAARDPRTGEFSMVGKTFKGLTDEEFEGMTERLLRDKISESDWGVRVRPSVVVEVAFDEIQRSPVYASGFALRFARIVRIRDDKDPSECATLEEVEELYERQFERKGRPSR